MAFGVFGGVSFVGLLISFGIGGGKLESVDRDEEEGHHGSDDDEDESHDDEEEEEDRSLLADGNKRK